LLPLVHVVDDPVARHGAVAEGEVRVVVARVLHRRLARHPEPLAAEADDPAVAHTEGDVLVLPDTPIAAGDRSRRCGDPTDPHRPGGTDAAAADHQPQPRLLAGGLEPDPQASGLGAVVVDDAEL